MGLTITNVLKTWLVGKLQQTAIQRYDLLSGLLLGATTGDVAKGLITSVVWVRNEYIVLLFCEEYTGHTDAGSLCLDTCARVSAPHSPKQTSTNNAIHTDYDWSNYR